jgi:hypothetical protein
MKGIYLTQEGKQEIEAKIAEIESYEGLESGFADTLKEILSSATILPVEESWDKLEENLLEGLHEHTKLENVISIDYPQGVIIQPKQ